MGLERSLTAVHVYKHHLTYHGNGGEIALAPQNASCMAMGLETARAVLFSHRSSYWIPPKK